jgi:hypothetical protein
MKKPFGCYIIQWLRSYKPFSHCAGLWFISDIYELLGTHRITQGVAL